MNLRRPRHFRDIESQLAHPRRNLLERRARVYPDGFRIDTQNRSAVKRDDDSAEKTTHRAGDRRVEAPFEVVIPLAARLHLRLEAPGPVRVDVRHHGVERLVNAPEAMDVDDLRKRPRAV